jgi:hypothetical protein
MVATFFYIVAVPLVFFACAVLSDLLEVLTWRL